MKNVFLHDFTNSQNNYSSTEDLASVLNKMVEGDNLFKELIGKDPSYSKKTLLGKLGTFVRELKINISFIDFHSWDTHTMQGTMNGKFNKLLTNLSNQLLDLKVNLDYEWQNTTVVMLSEFGRTIKENGVGGTNHEHANLISVFGGNINESKIVGEYDNLDLECAHEKRDLNLQVDYRDIISLILRKFGYCKDSLDFIFPRNI